MIYKIRMIEVVICSHFRRFIYIKLSLNDKTRLILVKITLKKMCHNLTKKIILKWNCTLLDHHLPSNQLKGKTVHLETFALYFLFRFLHDTKE